MAKLSSAFYNRDTVQVARELVGKYLVRILDQTPLVCRITETEAYIGRCDKACHAYHYRHTKRTETLFTDPGTAYIYFVYGIHHCLNFVTEPEGEPSAVLIRGGTVIHGIDTISQLRFGKKPEALSNYQRKNFLNGPGKLCKGLALTRQLNGINATNEPLFVCDTPADLDLAPEKQPIPTKIHVGKRIGIDYAEEAVDFPWRFFVTN